MSKFKTLILVILLLELSCNSDKQEVPPQEVKLYQQMIDSLKLELKKKDNQLIKLYQTDSLNDFTYAHISRALQECKQASNKATLKNNFPLRILTTVTLHQDELQTGDQQRRWIGLFRGSHEDYIEQVEVQFTNVQDPLIDNGNEKTGWKPTPTSTEDSCLFLISGIKLHKRSPANFMKINQNTILPGDTLQFTFLRHSYKISATGQINKWKVVSDYNLYLQVNDHAPQLLVSEERFDDEMINILWTGDVNQDGFLDLIIDTSNHYNVMEVSLFLSSGEHPDLLKKVAVQRMVGC